MPATKIQRFLGEAPRIAPELLPDSAAQVALNTKLYSGDLIPYRTPVGIDRSNMVGKVVRTLHGLRNPDNPDDLKWLTWDKDVDIVQASDDDENTPGIRGRFFYSGDGVPKVSTYDMAVSGTPPYPADYFELGLPLPQQRLSASATPANPVAIATIARDSGNTATIVTAAPHGLRSGNVVSVTNIKDDDNDEDTFNTTNSEVIVINPTTITYFSPGDELSTTSIDKGSVALAGGTLPRAYVYTWMTPWGEESVPSEPSKDIFLKEGQTVTVTGIPQQRPIGKNFIRGLRLYRTVVSVGGTHYFRLRTLWFPIPLARAKRENNIATMTLAEPHNLIVGDRFKISNSSQSEFNIVDGVVLSVVDRNTFTYSSFGSPIADTVLISGRLFHDASESTDDPARYWGDGSYEFVDDYDIMGLVFPLASEFYDPPPRGLQGLTAIQNNILVGFVGQKLFFSEPDRPHAWPERYALTFDAKIVAVGMVAGYLIVLTEKYPYRVSGSDPAVMTYARIDAMYPCLSKRSVVNMGYGIAYATHGGVAVFSPTAGPDILTKHIHSWDTWSENESPESMVAQFYNGAYFASSSKDSFIFERDEKIGGFFTKVRYRFDSAWNDPHTNRMYFTDGTNGLIYEWDNPRQPMAPLEWKSKKFVVAEYANMGAARVIADYLFDQEEADIIDEYNQQVIEFNIEVWQERDELGTVNNYLFDECQINGDPFTRDQLPYPAGRPVVFRMWADGDLVFQAQINSDAIFRLPTGYKADTFEVSVSGSGRIKAIQLGETPYGLRSV